MRAQATEVTDFLSPHLVPAVVKSLRSGNMMLWKSSAKFFKTFLSLYGFWATM